MTTAILISQNDFPDILEMVDEVREKMNIKASARQVAASVLRDSLPIKIAELETKCQEKSGGGAAQFMPGHVVGRSVCRNQ